jgi:hypothetical protein
MITGELTVVMERNGFALVCDEKRTKYFLVNNDDGAVMQRIAPIHIPAPMPDDQESNWRFISRSLKKHAAEMMHAAFSIDELIL